MDRPPDKPPAESRAPQVAKALYNFQKFIVQRAWAIILLLVLSQIGGLLAKHLWSPDRERLGRELTHYALILLGLILFWIWPKRIRFMRRVVALLITCGSIVVAVCLLLGAISEGWTFRDAWRGQSTYILAELGRRWVISGLALGLLMGLGLLVRARILARRKARREGTSAPPKPQPSPQPQPPAQTPERPTEPKSP
ncbi:MAG: hypothetical protein KF866_06830 [Phycisphaeraceae bacterium]|nr:hypothetical protein [Phycisphaeraceae bacterium]